MTRRTFDIVPAAVAALFSFSAAAWIEAAPGTGPIPSAGEAVTFAKHIAPIVFQNCAECHRPGQAGPFPLTNFEETKKRARLISEVTGDRTMPPWQPDEGCGDFVGERRLTKEQIGMLQRWAETGMAEGDASQTPPLPKFAEGWRHGEPDLVLTMDEAFTVPADGPDIYRQFVIPLALDEDKWVQAIEVRPGSRGALHHVLLWLDSSGEARKMDASDPGPGFAKMGFRRTGGLGGWAVGGGPRAMPDGWAYPLPKGSDLVLSSHFHPTGKEEQEKTTIGIYFAKKAPERKMVALQLPPLFGRGVGLDIPPGEATYKVTDELTLPVDTDIIAVSAHAHYLGKSMGAIATLPDGSKKNLFRISDWNFNWQDQYVYKEPVRLPAGTKINATIIWDNSANNPNNPSSPPKRVTWGEESLDEMGSITFASAAAEVASENKLAATSRVRLREMIGQGRGGMKKAIAALAELKKFPELDVNHDLKLSGEEIPEAIRSTERLMSILDANKDGNLEVTELLAAKAKWSTFKEPEEK